MNFLSFCLSGKVFCLHSEEEFCWVKYSGWRFLSFSTLNISSHSLLACEISAVKSANSLKEVPLYERICFSSTFKILCVWF